ncbi:MAG TPA: nodulation protein NfeD [Actinomycetota bacterium]|nr:nodulation protein NfeD [Actinomycetota bacterium]
MNRARLVAGGVLLAGGLALAPGAANGQGQAPAVVALSVDGVVDPFLASYVERGIADANAAGSAAILITIDTPGGLDSSMRRIIQSVLASRVPVICYVSPPGARAASAGTFILIACPVAAMAPGTNVGAAHPVGISGAIESQKVLNDAAAYIRSLAEQRGRNADWAERAVRQSISASAEEALDLGVIDLISADRGALLADLDGESVVVAGDERVALRTAGATIDDRSLGLGPRILHAVLTPDLAFLFFFLGLGLIVVELLHPGVSVPGVLGVVFLVAAFIAFGLLPVTIVGLALLIASAVAFLIDLKVPGSGVATAVGVITLVLGGLLLFDRSVPSARVSIPLIVTVAALLALFFAVTVRAVLLARRRPVEMGIEGVVGQTGVATTVLGPQGTVYAAREHWSAESATGEPIAKGTPVRVVAMRGLRVLVEPAPVEAETREAT